MKRRTKQRIKGVLVAWRLLVIAIIAAGLVPLFLAARHNATFYTLTVMLSILAYLITIQLRPKRGLIKRFLERLATRLLAALILLALAGVTRGLAQTVLLVAAAVGYAAVLQNVSFLKVV